MDDLNPSFVFVGVDGEDLIQDEFEVKEEKPVFNTQNYSANCDPAPAQKETKKKRNKKNYKYAHIKGRLRSSARLANKRGQTDTNKDPELENVANSSGEKQVNNNSETVFVNNENNQPHFQAASATIKTEKCFNFDNNNELVSTVDSVDEQMNEIVDPLENHCDFETTHKVKQEPTSDTQTILKPKPTKQPNVKLVQVDPRIFAPYIKKLCGHCKRVTELVLNDTSDKSCNICRKFVTYCCKLCLEMGGINDLYIHVFKKHSDKLTYVQNTSTQSYEFLCTKCGVRYQNYLQLIKHDQFCNVLPNLFCQFCPAKMKSKHEMRQHVINLHMRHYRMSMEYLENMLDAVIQEGDDVMSLLTRHFGYCEKCKKNVSLLDRPIYCLACCSELVYHCQDTSCSARVFTRLTSLHDHMRWHVKKGFTIDPSPPPRQQNKSTSSNSNKSSQSTKVKLCHLCGDFSGDLVSLRKHMTVKHPDIVLCKCDLCGKNLKNVHLWKKHQKGYCPVRYQKFQCEHCQFRCYKKKRLRKHLRSFHTYLYLGKRPQCNKCGITWAGLYRLREHEKKCSGQFKVEKAKQRESWDRRRVEISCE